MNDINIAALQTQGRVGEGGVVTTHKMTHYAFISRMTIDEDVALEVVLPNNPLMRVALRRFQNAQDIDVSLPETAQLVGLLATTLRAGEAPEGQTIVAIERLPALLAPKPIAERGAINPLTGYTTP